MCIQDIELLKKYLNYPRKKINRPLIWRVTSHGTRPQGSHHNIASGWTGWLCGLAELAVWLTAWLVLADNWDELAVWLVLADNWDELAVWLVLTDNWDELAVWLTVWLALAGNWDELAVWLTVWLALAGNWDELADWTVYKCIMFLLQFYYSNCISHSPLYDKALVCYCCPALLFPMF